MLLQASPVAIDWACVSNVDHQETFSAHLALRNASAAPIAAGWAIYFNTCRKIVTGSAAHGFTIDHVNGDLFRLGATDTAAWQPGQVLEVPYLGQFWTISATDAPLGFYLVHADGSVTALGDPAIAPFAHPRQQHRGPNDATPLDDEAGRFAQNAAVHLLAPADVGRITPQPVMALFDQATCTLGRGTTIVASAGLANETALLRAILDQLPDVPGAAQIELTTCGDGAPEAYSIDITMDAIRIASASAHGVFNAIQSLRQLIDRGQVPRGRVVDGPRFAYRGLMLDVARHFASKETVLRLLDCMALYKLNRFHFHLTDDEGWRFPVPALPELTSVGARRGVSVDGDVCLPPSFGSGADIAGSPGTGHYSADDFIAILRHAQGLHIEVIPEVNMPGHARAAIVAMRARGDADYLLDDPQDRSRYESVQLWHDNVICIALPSVDRFVDTVVAALVALYRTAGVALRTIHLGGDEVPNGAWEGSPMCQALMAQRGWTHVDQLRADFLARCQAILARHGVACAGWEENALEGRAPSTRFAGGGLQVYAWNNAWGNGQEDVAYRLANAGYPVVLANAAHLYFDLAHAKESHEPGYYWAGFVGTRDAFTFCPLDATTTAGRTPMGRTMTAAALAAMTRLTPAGTANIVGLQGQLFGENARTPECIEYMAAPRLIALAERAWSPDPHWPDSQAVADDWNAFANRLGQRVLAHLDATMAYGYRLPPPGVARIDGAIHANVALPGLALHYTLDGSDPTSSSPCYTGPVAAASISIATFDTRGRKSRTIHFNLQGHADE
ncbi:MAG: carbohydate-binding domain-containing protein [Pseudomonadota bacterium]|nr:carbohydate-binding domain-containing protein [Pseudomonadota bacterium]